MGYFRFQRRNKLLPGVRWNISKTASSISFGGHGATVNLSDKGTRTTLGLPGSGLSYVSTQRRSTQPRPTPGSFWTLVRVAIGICAAALTLIFGFWE